jgi:hypothetical protein
LGLPHASRTALVAKVRRAAAAGGTQYYAGNRHHDQPFLSQCISGKNKLHASGNNGSVWPIEYYIFADHSLSGYQNMSILNFSEEVCGCRCKRQLRIVRVHVAVNIYVKVYI